MVKEKHTGHNNYNEYPLKVKILTWLITVLGCGLFAVDIAMLLIFYLTIRSIIKYYTKDYRVNTCFVWFCVHVVATTYVIEMIWSDLFMWGNFIQTDEWYFDSKSIIPL